MRAPQNRILALARLELLTALRDRTGYAMFAFSLLAGLVALPGMRWLGSSAEADLAERAQREEGAERAVCPPVDRAPILVEGSWPAWLVWPEPFATSADGVVRVDVTTDEDGLVRFDLSEGSKEARDEVESCLLDALSDRRRERFATLGLSHDPDALVAFEAGEVAVEAATGRDLLARWSPLGTVLAVLGLVVAGGVAIEAVPRRRGSGLLEQLRSTQTATSDLVIAWLLAIVGLAGVHLVVASLAYLVSTLVLGGSPGPLAGAVHAPVFALLVAAASVRTSLHANDVQAASLRWFAVIFALVLGSGLSALIAVELPWVAALIPLGGSILAASGVLEGWGFLADLSGLGWTALLVADSARSLAGEDSSAAGNDAALARRARGSWGPEAFVLGAMGLSTAVAGGGAGDQPWVGITLAFLVFMLLPALLAGPVLGVPVRELLPVGRPSVRVLLLVVPLTVGLMALGQLVVTGSVAVMPSNGLIEKFTEDLTGLATTPYGAVAIAVYPALCEELLYRGAILGLLMRSGRPWLAITGQAVAFALAHVISVRLPWTFVMGLVLGWLRVRTGSLWVCMAVHFLFNGSGVLWMLVGSEGDVSLWWWVPALIGLGVLPMFPRAPRDGETPVER